MKKMLFILCSALILSTQAHAMNCEGGSIITGVDGTLYCKSATPVNWYSALVWCKRHKTHLASIEEVCRSNETSGTCQNMPRAKSNRYFWFSNGRDNTYAFLLGGGHEISYAEKNSIIYHAICVSD